MSEENKDQETPDLSTDVEGVDADDTYKGTPVFNVSQDEFYKNQRLSRNRMRFKNGSKPQQFMQGTKYRKPFYVATEDGKGEKILYRVK